MPGVVPVLLRHQVGAAAATLADFGLMIVLVQLLHVSPTPATAVGALFGSIVNFTLARHWIFDRKDRRVTSQAIRYAVVSLGSLLLNSLGEYIGCTGFGLGYLGVRVVVALIVGTAWNFPLHRGFVFHAADGERGDS